MKIAVVLTHNKTDWENAAQISALAALLTTVTTTQTINNFTLGPGKTVISQTPQTITFSHQEFAVLPSHPVLVYQIVPYGVVPPANISTLASHNVYYGKGDENKVSNHPRFPNWGLKRATDYGADLVVLLDDIKSFSPPALSPCLNDTVGLCALDTFPWGKILHNTVQYIHGERVAVLNETLSTPDAFIELGQTLVAAGLGVKNG